MARGLQLSLFGIGLGEDQLFGPKILEQYLQQHRTTPIPEQAERAKRLRQWLDSLQNTTATEKSLKTKFISDVLCGVLGYTAYPVPRGVAASLYPEPPTRVTGISRSPDAVFGLFINPDFQFTTAVELKTPGTDLDMPQPSYGNETPIQQGFFYGRNILGMRWVLVSDMQVARLYSVESPWGFEEVDFAVCVGHDGVPTDEFRRLYFLLHHDYLVQGHESSQISLLHAKSAARRLEIRDAFYEAYYTIRSDLYEAILKASAHLTPPPARPDLLGATQRLLDRLLFIYYCEDHPQQFIENGTIERVTSAAGNLPGSSATKVYGYLKALFREIDVGSPPTSGVNVAGYNGELFKDPPIIDHIELPDSLHKKAYEFNEPNGTVRKIKGVWGLHVYDFWAELNEHVLGHIFEESLSDLEDLGTGEARPVSDRVEERRQSGIYYTTSILSDFLSESAIRATISELAPIGGSTPDELFASLKHRLDCLLNLRVVDFACGSGAFLVSVYREILQEFMRLRTSLNAFQAQAKKAELPFEIASQSGEQFSLLRNCVFGVDKLPQAVEIAKLALWLRSARKDEKVLDLSSNLVSANSLDIEGVLSELGAEAGSFDLVIGNPPWGGSVEADIYDRVLADLGLSQDRAAWDSWELFLLLGLKALRPGGRLALVLPDSFLYPQKARLRRILFDATTPEKVHNLGPGWFGPHVRMGTVVLQARRGSLDLNAEILSVLLAGKIRGKVIRGEVLLTQIEAQRGRLIPVARTAQNPGYELEVFRGSKDDQIMGRMLSHSRSLEAVCERGRGEEMSKTGLYWVCPSCLAQTTPGTKKKGGGYKNKVCPDCGHTLTETTAESSQLVTASRPSKGVSVTFIDGDDVSRRYQRVVPNKWLQLDLSGWSYKSPDLYSPPKILVRQAGVGLVATLDETASRCPQSIYIYRLRADEVVSGYEYQFILGALLSRTMTYFVFKRYAEVDPDKAHPKLTHERLSDLPIPRVDFENQSQRRLHDSIVNNVRRLLKRRSRTGWSRGPRNRAGSARALGYPARGGRVYQRGVLRVAGQPSPS